MSLGLKLLFYNYVDLDILANSDVSSEQTAFPVANAYNKTRRSKVWRSEGYFNITSSNNEIIFRETAAGPDLTATIAVAEYDSITDLCAAIKTALEAVGASTYTVTNSISTSWKFNIVSDGSGGDGVFYLYTSNVLFTAADVLGFGTDTDFTSASLTRTADFLRINTEEWLLWDMGIETNPTTFALIGPRNTPLRLSSSGTFKLQGNESNDFTAPSFETTLEYNDNCFFYDDADGIGSQAYRFWRVLFEDQNPNGYVEVGAFFLGNGFNPAVGRPQFPLDIIPEDRSETIFSEGGQSVSVNRQSTQSYQFKFFNLQKADVEELEAQFVNYGVGKPFFVALDAEAVFSTSESKRVVFCKFSEAPQISLITPNVFEATILLREEL